MPRKSRATGRPKGRPKRHDWNQILDLYEQHQSVSHVSRILSADRTAVLYALRHMGVDTSGKAMRMRRWEKKLAARAVPIAKPVLERAREQYLNAVKQARSARIERMMTLACPKRKRMAA